MSKYKSINRGSLFFNTNRDNYKKSEYFYSSDEEDTFGNICLNLNDNNIINIMFSKKFISFSDEEGTFMNIFIDELEDLINTSRELQKQKDLLKGLENE